jgi:uncharacterized protein YkwD
MRRHLLILAVSLAAALVMPAGASAACSGSDVQPTPENLDQVAATTLCLVNEQRSANGLNPLAAQDELAQASLDYSQLMVDEQFFAHESPEGSVLTQRLTDSGYLGGDGAWIVGENIAWGESYLGSPGSIVAAWMNSPGHRTNILSPDYDEIGIGIAVGVPTSTNDGGTYTTDFGHRDNGDSDGVDDGTDPADGTGGLAVDDTVVDDTPAPVATKHTVSKTAVKHKTTKHKAKSKAKVACKLAGHRGASRQTRCLAVLKHRQRTR